MVIDGKTAVWHSAIDSGNVGGVEQHAGRPASPALLPDLDTPERVDAMVASFYRQLLADDLLAPLFTDVADIDLPTHLPLISAYWQKMLWGDRRYRRHMMDKHRAIHARHPFTGSHHERWLYLFYTNLDAHYYGPMADKAKRIAAKVIHNLYVSLTSPP